MGKVRAPCAAAPAAGALLAWLSLERPAPARLEPNPAEPAPPAVPVGTGGTQQHRLPPRAPPPLAPGSCSRGVSPLLCGAERVLSSPCTGSSASQGPCPASPCPVPVPGQGLCRQRGEEAPGVAAPRRPLRRPPQPRPVLPRRERGKSSGDGATARPAGPARPLITGGGGIGPLLKMH